MGEQNTIASVDNSTVGDVAKAADFLSQQFDVKDADDMHEVFAALTKSLKSAAFQDAAIT